MIIPFPSIFVSPPPTSILTGGYCWKRSWCQPPRQVSSDLPPRCVQPRIGALVLLCLDDLNLPPKKDYSWNSGIWFWQKPRVWMCPPHTFCRTRLSPQLVGVCSNSSLILFNFQHFLIMVSIYYSRLKDTGCTLPVSKALAFFSAIAIKSNVDNSKIIFQFSHCIKKA